MTVLHDHIISVRFNTTVGVDVLSIFFMLCFVFIRVEYYLYYYLQAM